jgi:hypothetical protein
VPEPPLPALRTPILTLLEHYRDVLEGIYDRGQADDILALMCRAWNSPAYQTLERLLERMKHERPWLRAHLLRRYLHFQEVRRAYCRKCGLHPPVKVGSVHRHPPGRSVTLTPVVARVTPDDVSEAEVERAIDWLVANWPEHAVPIIVPDDVHAIERERALRPAAVVVQTKAGALRGR